MLHLPPLKKNSQRCSACRRARATRSHDPDGRTISQLDTPFHNPREEEVTEVEVTDPTHALFGQRFPLLSLSAPSARVERVLVGFRGHMALRIPVGATNLAPARPCPRSKLTLAAITELISLAEQCEVLCPSNREKSGDACRQDSVARSLPTSPRSCKR